MKGTYDIDTIDIIGVTIWKLQFEQECCRTLLRDIVCSAPSVRVDILKFCGIGGTFSIALPNHYMYLHEAERSE